MTAKWKLVLFGLIAIGVFIVIKVFHLEDIFTLQYLKSQHQTLVSLYQDRPVAMIGAFSAIYILSTALSIPGATVLTLAGGAIFGLWFGVLIISFSSTIGATLAFILSRFFFRDWVKEKFPGAAERIDAGVKKEGAFYLFSLRLVPLFPFFLINLVTGLTPLSLITFFWVSQLGMLPGTFVYVNAGTQLGSLKSASGVLSTEMLLSFAAIGLLPLFSRWGLQCYHSRKKLKKFKRPRRFDYNAVVIGAGSAGLVSAYIAATVKAKVALIEKERMGGDCLNTGCVPSKAFIRSAKIVSYHKRATEFGLRAQAAKVDLKDIMARVKRVIRKVEPHDSVERYSGIGVECLKGEAKIVSPFEVNLNGRTLTTKNIIIATGASPLVPKIPGLDRMRYLTSENVWALDKLPSRLLVLGGGPIGCELTQAFARLGSKVSIIEMAPRLLGREDEEVSSLIENVFRSEGVAVLTNHRAKHFEVNEKGEKVLVCESKDKLVSIAFDEVLLALGRSARTNGFGLEELGIEVTKKGTVANDEFLRTNYPNIFVCGDVAGPFQFTHTAAHQAWFATVNALFRPLVRFKVDYRVIPWATFTDPEVAHVGLNEIEAKEKKIPYEVTRYPIDDLDRAIAEEEDRGFVKVLTVPKKDQILGVTIVGPHAGDIIAEYVLAMKQKIGLGKILGTIHIYPTLAEANKYAAGNWKKAHISPRLLSMLQKYFSFLRG